jgi:hypothetical protein
MRARAEAITTGDLLVRAAERFGGEPVLDGLTFTGLRDAAAGVARGLIAAEVPRYARVTVTAGDLPDRASLILGVALAGAASVLGTGHAETDVACTIGPGAWPADPGGYASALELRRLGARLRDPALIVDGVALTHEAIVRTWRSWALLVGLAPEDRLWVAAPGQDLPWFGGLLACLSAGSRLVDSPAKATVGLILGASPVPDPAPVTLLRGYGPTAASGLATATAPGESDGGYGAPLPGVGLSIGDGEEIIIRGYNLADADPGTGIDDRGWLHTGDRGRLDDRGRLRDLVQVGS